MYKSFIIIQTKTERRIHMNLDIRSHIINNFKGDDITTLKDAINESIKNNDEITLPGMGVFFELVWQKADEELKNKILSILEECVKGGNQ